MLARYAGADLTAPVCAQTLTRPRLQDIHHPTLVINGEFDLRSRRLAGEALGKSLPHAAHRIIPGAGHLPNLDQPQTYNEILRHFLQRTHGAA
jgi:pimeloyl-ACP methyl ester carboxylesterase